MDGNVSSLEIFLPETTQSSLFDVLCYALPVIGQLAANGSKRAFQLINAQSSLRFRNIKQELDITILTLELVHRLTTDFLIPAQYIAFDIGVFVQVRKIINNLLQLFGQYGGVRDHMSDGCGFQTDGDLPGRGILAVQTSKNTRWVAKDVSAQLSGVQM